jgi:hypothetical protein
MPHLERGKDAMSWGEERGSMTMSVEAGPMTCVVYVGVCKGGREDGRKKEC